MLCLFEALRVGREGGCPWLNARPSGAGGLPSRTWAEGRAGAPNSDPALCHSPNQMACLVGYSATLASIPGLPKMIGGREPFWPSRCEETRNFWKTLLGQCSGFHI